MMRTVFIAALVAAASAVKIMSSDGDGETHPLDFCSEVMESILSIDMSEMCGEVNHEEL